MNGLTKILWYLEGLCSGVEMAWGSLQHDTTLYWSPNGLLDAFVHVLFAFLVLVCTILNFFTSSFIRVSGFYIPCSHCTHLQEALSGSAVEASSSSFTLPKSKCISAPVVSEVTLNGFHHKDEYLRAGEVKNFLEFSPTYDSTESTSGEPLVEISEDEEGEACKGASVLLSGQADEDCNDSSQEDLDREQYGKAQELLHTLQSERNIMAGLYIELEEERRSSATAAREALAMISRLQEEKAAVQMESRQFQRMVMEKAMYDQEAIEVLTEILAKREDERLALEEEIELCRERLDAVLMEERDYAERAGRDPVPMLRALQSERKIMAALYIELEEERRSSATAAREALAMISRLQEEKAAVQMESRQFQRMVMEKAMYDQEAIEMLTEILAKHEDERLALEEEIEVFRERLDAVLMEERNDGERAGRDLVPMLLLEGTPTEEESTSPKCERAELPSFERITPSGRISKNERIPLNGRIGKDERITPHGRLAKEEEAEFLDRLNKTKSQLLTALLQEGISEPASALEESASFADEIHEAMAKIPVRAESLPILDHQTYKASSGLGAIKVDRETGTLPIPPPTVAKKHTEMTLAKDAGKAYDEPVFVSRKPTSPPSVVKQTDMTLTKDTVKAADEPVCISRKPSSPPTVVRKHTEKSVTKDAGRAVDEALPISREMSLPILPPLVAKRQESNMPKDAGKSAHDHVFISRKTSLSIGPHVAGKKQTESFLMKDDEIAGDEPMLASLKRRWSARGSQESLLVSMAETLAKEKEDRIIEEKRLSVLEYVKNLEEVLQQQTGKPAARGKSVDGREEDV